MADTFQTEHEHRLNRNEWLYNEIHSLCEELSVIDAIDTALFEQLTIYDIFCPRVKEYYDTWNGLTMEQQENIAYDWDNSSKCFEDCIAEYLND